MLRPPTVTPPHGNSPFCACACLVSARSCAASGGKSGSGGAPRALRTGGVESLRQNSLTVEGHADGNGRHLVRRLKLPHQVERDLVVTDDPDSVDRAHRTDTIAPWCIAEPIELRDRAIRRAGAR